MTQITDGLRDIEKEYNVTVLFAAEAGSRAWGIESPDSDWDIRFIYKHPENWYLSPWEGRDVIEKMDGDLDFSGWDLGKACRLAYKSNPSLLEWLHSPIIYETRNHFQARMKNILRDFSPKSLMHHYVSLAQRQYKAYWKAEFRVGAGGKVALPVSLKKYLYAIRPVMAVDWMVENRYIMPPVDFLSLRGDMNESLGNHGAEELKDLLSKKAVSGEKMGKGRYPALDVYIKEGIEIGRKLADAAPSGAPCKDMLNGLFLSEVKT